MLSTFIADQLAVIADGNNFDISAFGRKWRLCRNANLEELWERLGAEDFQDERIPYWTELWPASLGLARWLYNQKTSLWDRLALDLGCGLGFTALVGAWLGARVIACDYESEALCSCIRNAQLNDINSVSWLCMDWRFPAIAGRSLDFIWGGDIIYERRSMEPLLELCEHSLGINGVAWLAEPGRSVFLAFPDLAAEYGFSLKPVFTGRESAIHAGERQVNVTIWEARRK